MLCDVDLRLGVLSVVGRMGRDRRYQLSVHHSDPGFASLCVKDTSHVGLLVPGSLRSESVAVEDDVLLSFSSSRNEGDQVSSRCCHDNGRR